ncbi:hypothetical protein CO046_03755 [Candidatus Peregrinibacteria bacterium CG_4_9_14_0_2_um_filter_53_11]|nr:MAG: hypothetical protein CO046_03755 [Candidatus Peregrinibacteria bacterium CG_4_9_14_0_2_um_filter_53_11]
MKPIKGPEHRFVAPDSTVPLGKDVPKRRLYDVITAGDPESGDGREFLARNWQPTFDANGELTGLSYKDTLARTVTAVVQPDGRLIIDFGEKRFVASPPEGSTFDGVLRAQFVRQPISFRLESDHAAELAAQVGILRTTEGAAVSVALGELGLAADDDRTVPDLSSVSPADLDATVPDLATAANTVSRLPAKVDESGDH